jgi:hypothetical protein
MELTMKELVGATLVSLNDLVAQEPRLSLYAHNAAVALIRTGLALGATGADEALEELHWTQWIVDAFAECGIFTGCAWSCAGCGKVCGKNRFDVCGKNRFDVPVPEVEV